MQSTFQMLCPCHLGWPQSSQTSLAVNLTYHFLGPVAMCWSHLASEGLSGDSPHSPHMLIQHRRPFVPQPATFLKKKKKSAFHFNDDTTQRWGSCYRIQGIWAEVIGVIKSSSRGIPSFLHKLPIWELCVISHYRREWLCLTSAGRENLSHFSFSRERELGSIDMEFLLFLQFLAFSWCI